MNIQKLEHLLNEGKGALPIQAIQTLKEEGFIKYSYQNPGPASLDLTLTEDCYEIERVIMPREGERVLDLIKSQMGGKRTKSTILHPGKQYLIRVYEKFTLPQQLYGYANPKSTTGRLFIHSRIMADGVDMYDHVPRNWRGTLWALVEPKVFVIEYNPKTDALSQMRILIKDARMSQLEIQSLQRKEKIMKRKMMFPVRDRRRAIVESVPELIENDYKLIRGRAHGYMIFSADCEGHNGIAGYKAVPYKLPINLQADNLDWKKYYDVVRADEYLELDPKAYYILSTKESVSIPPNFAAEVKPIDVRAGEFRAHYAGFIDPGFGYDREEPLNGNTITLEVRTYERMIIRHGQCIAYLQFERMAAAPNRLYASTSGNYAKQIGAKLPRQFKMSK